MSTLTVVADDFGMNTFRTDGILECHRCGTVSQASLMVNGDDTVRAVRLAKSARLPLGLHFNLTEGSAVSHSRHVYFTAAATGTNEKHADFACVASCGCDCPAADADDEAAAAAVRAQQKSIATQLFGNNNSSGGGVLQLQGKECFFERFGNRPATDTLAVNAVLEELCAQLARFEQLTGHFPFSLDGHHHIHVLPVVAKALAIFYKSPSFDDLSSVQKEIVGRYLPGTAAGAAVCGLRYLRVPLPPLGDLSRTEDWRGSSCCSGNGSNNNDVTDWSAATAFGPPFFARLVSCAYEAMLLWERSGLFGPVEVVVAAKNQQQQQQPLVVVSLPGSASSSPVRERLAQQAQHHHHQHEAAPAEHRMDVVDQLSPMRRRGVVVTTEVDCSNEQRSNESNTAANLSTLQQQHGPAGLAVAIIPRRLVSFASGPRLNAEHITSSLINYQREEELLSQLRNEALEEVSQSRSRARVRSSNNNARNETTAQQQQQQYRYSQLQLFERELQIGRSEEANVPSLYVEPWATPMEAELMTHPGVQMPPLPSQLAAEEAKKNQQEQQQQQVQQLPLPPINQQQVAEQKRLEDQERFAYYGAITDRFYCKWSQSSDRVHERELLSTNAADFAQAVAAARFAVKAYSEVLHASGRS